MSVNPYAGAIKKIDINTMLECVPFSDLAQKLVCIRGLILSRSLIQNTDKHGLSQQYKQPAKQLTRQTGKTNTVKDYHSKVITIKGCNLWNLNFYLREVVPSTTHNSSWLYIQIKSIHFLV